jgi:hypothetical protein
MLYRPNFCCNCGEKIERANWTIFTSRKFCELCCSELQFMHWGPRLLALGSLVIGVAVISGFFRPAARQTEIPARTAALAAPAALAMQPEGNFNTTPRPIQQSQVGQNTDPGSSTSNSSLSSSIPVGPRPGEAVYFCGAATKKGTPCSRRVKHRGERCWQHAGMPSMADNSENSRQ